MKKLTDAQVTTLVFIIVKYPPVPSDLERFPTLRMFLEEGIIKQLNGHLFAVYTKEEINYQDVVSSEYLDKMEPYSSFADLARDERLAFHPSSAPTETDTFFYWDAMQLRSQVALLGGWIPLGFEGPILLPKDAEKAKEATALWNAFVARYGKKEKKE